MAEAWTDQNRSHPAAVHPVERRLPKAGKLHRQEGQLPGGKVCPIQMRWPRTIPPPVPVPSTSHRAVGDAGQRAGPGLGVGRALAVVGHLDRAAQPGREQFPDRRVPDKVKRPAGVGDSLLGVDPSRHRDGRPWYCPRNRSPTASTAAKQAVQAVHGRGNLAAFQKTAVPPPIRAYLIKVPPMSQCQILFHLVLLLFLVSIPAKEGVPSSSCPICVISSAVRAKSNRARFSSIRARWLDFGITPIPFCTRYRSAVCAARLAVARADLVQDRLGKEIPPPLGEGRPGLHPDAPGGQLLCSPSRAQ